MELFNEFMLLYERLNELGLNKKWENIVKIIDGFIKFVIVKEVKTVVKEKTNKIGTVFTMNDYYEINKKFDMDTLYKKVQNTIENSDDKNEMLLDIFKVFGNPCSGFGVDDDFADMINDFSNIFLFFAFLFRYVQRSSWRKNQK